jgi:hypothetical protein
MTHNSSLKLDAEALYLELLRGVRTLLGPQTRLVGITSGGAWLAERLQKDLQLPDEPGTISSAMHRDDFAQRGLSAGGQTMLPFDVNGAPSAPCSMNCSTTAAPPASSWPCWWTGAGENCRSRPTLRQPAWHGPARVSWHWCVTTPAPSASTWKATKEKSKDKRQI